MLMRNDRVCLLEHKVVPARHTVPVDRVPARMPATATQTTAATRRVLLLVDTSSAYGRGVLHGIARYNRDHGRWSLCCRADGTGGEAPESWAGEGVIANTANAQVARFAQRTGAAVVNVSGTSAAGLSSPYVGVDNAQVARLAAGHLRERGMPTFAFCGRAGDSNPAVQQRRDHFCRAIEKNGQSCQLYPQNDVRATRQLDWEVQQEHLADWIRSLPKPVGIMACDDDRGLAVLDACRRARVTVPDDVAVIGVNNDESLCALAIPPLSSIDVNAEGVGYEAAALLERLMDGRTAPPPPTRPVLLAPRGVITRRSSDVVAAEDEEVSRAVLYIRNRACGGLQVGDVLAHTGMSRASLQQRMKHLLGRTIHQEIQRARLSRAKDLLAMSALTIKQVARESGFASVQYMTRVFRAETGETPARYRGRRSTLARS